MARAESKTIPRLSDEDRELADCHAIEEKKLCYVAALPQELHTEIVRQIIGFNLSSKQVKELCEGDGTETTGQESEIEP